MDLKLVCSGDIMLGRGVDQILKFPGNATLYESFVKDARGYVEEIEKRLSRERRRDPRLLWVPLLPFIQETRPHVFLLNLETAITTSSRPWPKGINYKMNPDNIYILEEFRKDLSPIPMVFNLANNHILDWCMEGLCETLQVLKRKGLFFVGAGTNLEEAQTPFILRRESKGTLFVWGCVDLSAGADLKWGAKSDRPGVFLLGSDWELNVGLVKACILRQRFSPNDRKVLVAHIGPNWVKHIDSPVRNWFHRLIDELGFDLIINTSSHHILPVEEYKNALIIHGPGDFVSDYFGIEDPEYSHFNPDMGTLVSVRYSKGTWKPSFERFRFERIGFTLYPEKGES